MLITYLDDLESETDFPAHFYQGLYDGKSTLKSLTITETKKFDDYWISAIESYYPYIDRIVRNYKSTLRVEEEVVIVEKAKKTGSRTVRHLAANTHLLKRPDGNDDPRAVMPKKLLVEESEIEYGIYENRFIMTLIIRLGQFISSRIKILKEDVNTKKYHDVNSNIEFRIENSTYQIQLGLKEIETITQDSIAEHNQSLLQRSEELNKKMSGLMNSAFMKTMRGYKTVRSPIMKTQIILKNVDYKNCFLLWQYLDQYNSLGYELIRDEKQKRFNENYRKHLNQNALFAFSTLIYHDKFREKNAKLDLHKFKVKKAEILKINPEDLITDPKEYQIEDTRINEYYLNKNRQLFKKMIDSYMETEPKYEIALRKALKDTMDITNSLYASYFEIDAEDDMFARLVQETNPKEDLTAADQKFKVAEIIRTLKEQDYKRSVQLEKKWYTAVLKYQKEFFTWAKDENTEFTKKDALAVKKANQAYLKLERKKLLEDKKMQIANDNKMLLELKYKYKEAYKKETIRIAELHRKQAERAKAKLIKERDLAKAKLERAKEIQKKKQVKFIAKQKEKIKAQHQLAMDALKKGK